MLKKNDILTCRLDLINNKLLFKVNNNDFVDSKFNGFDNGQKDIGYYFAFTCSKPNCHVGVLRCHKIKV